MQTRKSDQPKPRAKRKTAKAAKVKPGAGWRQDAKLAAKRKAAEAKRRALGRPPVFNEKGKEREQLKIAMAEYAARGGVVEKVAAGSAIIPMRIENLVGYGR